MDVCGRAAEISPVTHGILDKGCGFRHPDGFAPTREPIDQDEPRALAALSAAGAVAKEIPQTVRPCFRIHITAQHLGLIGIDGKLARQVARVGIIGHNDGFELGLREMTLCDQAVGQAKTFGGVQ